MAGRKQKFISLGVIGLTTVLCVVFFFVRAWHLKEIGQPINYLAELWAPSSVLSIVIVTFVEKLAAPREAQPSKSPKKRKKQA